MRSSRRCRLRGVEVRVSVSRRRSSGMSSWSSRSTQEFITSIILNYTSYATHYTSYAAHCVALYQLY